MHPRSIINAANASCQSDGFWTDERLRLVRERAAAGCSAATIAAEIGGRCTRSMVVAKARRMGVKLDGFAAYRARVSERSRAVKAERLRKRIAALQTNLTALETPQPIPVARETSGRSA